MPWTFQCPALGILGILSAKLNNASYELLFLMLVLGLSIPCAGLAILVLFCENSADGETHDTDRNVYDLPGLPSRDAGFRQRILLWS